MNNTEIKIDEHYAALKLIEMLYNKSLINKATYENIMEHEGQEKESPIWERQSVL